MTRTPLNERLKELSQFVQNVAGLENVFNMATPYIFVDDDEVEVRFKLGVFDLVMFFDINEGLDQMYTITESGDLNEIYVKDLD